MNRYLIFLLLCFHALPQYGQDLEEYYPEGTVWKELWTHSTRPSSRFVVEFRVAGVNHDNGKEYRRIYIDGEYSPISVRQEGSLVYFRYGTQELRYERRLYDFDWHEGKTIPFSTLYEEADSTVWTYTISNISKYSTPGGKTLDWLPQIKVLRTVGSLETIFDYIYLHTPAVGEKAVTKVVSFVRDGEELINYNGPEPIAVPGKEWVVLNKSENGGAPWLSRYIISNDTVIGDVICHKLIGYDVKAPGAGESYCGSIFEQYGMVYLFKPYRIKSEYIYDFNLSSGCIVSRSSNSTEGDTYFVYSDSVFSESGTALRDYFLLKGERIPTFMSGATEGLPWNRWIEGVGSVFGPLNYGPCSEAEPSTRLVSCTVDGRTLYLDETLAVDAANLTPLPQISATYDLQGRRVSGTPRPGIYIRGGRKVVISKRVDK